MTINVIELKVPTIGHTCYTLAPISSPPSDNCRCEVSLPWALPTHGPTTLIKVVMQNIPTIQSGDYLEAFFNDHMGPSSQTFNGLYILIRLPDSNPIITHGFRGVHSSLQALPCTTNEGV